MSRLVRRLWFQVLIGTLAGIVLGIVAPKLADTMKPLGDGFIALVRMLIAPVIFCTVVHGIAGIRDMRRVGRVAMKALVYFEGVTLVALAMALAAVDLWRPGVGMHVDAATLDRAAVAGVTASAVPAAGIVPFLLKIIPTTFVSAFTSGDVLQALFVSVLFGFALTLSAEHEQVSETIRRVGQVFFRMVGIVMYVAPAAAFGSIAFTVGRFGVGSLLPLASLLLEFYVVSLLFVVIVLGLVARLARVSLWRLMVYFRDEIVIVAATTSTETVLPRLIQKLEALGCEESIVGLVIPTGYSFNLDGTCLYLATAAVFLAQATDTPLGLAQQLSLVALLLVSSKGAAGVAGAAFVVLAATLAALGTVPVAAVALILGIHRLMAEALTFVNLIGNCVATIVVAAWEGGLDRRRLDPLVGLAPRAYSRAPGIHVTERSVVSEPNQPQAEGLPP